MLIIGFNTRIVHEAGEDASLESLNKVVAIIFYLWLLKINMNSMEQIVIEVEPRIALAWKRLSAARRKDITNRAGLRLGKEVLKNSREEYLAYIDQLQNTMKERGLTQEILDEILNED
jgi:hypothetical protein